MNNLDNLHLGLQQTYYSEREEKSLPRVPSKKKRIIFLFNILRKKKNENTDTDMDNDGGINDINNYFIMVRLDEQLKVIAGKRGNFMRHFAYTRNIGVNREKSRVPYFEHFQGRVRSK